MFALTRLLRREAFDALLERSRIEPAAVLKHSTACGLSAMGLREFEALANETATPLYLVVVQEQRDVSNHIELVTGIRHESPQVLVLAGGRVAYHCSHRRVLRSDLRRALEQATLHTSA